MSHHEDLMWYWWHIDVPSWGSDVTLMTHWCPIMRIWCDIDDTLMSHHEDLMWLMTHWCPIIRIWCDIDDTLMSHHEDLMWHWWHIDVPSSGSDETSDPDVGDRDGPWNVDNFNKLTRVLSLYVLIVSELLFLRVLSTRWIQFGLYFEILFSACSFLILLASSFHLLSILVYKAFHLITFVSTSVVLMLRK
jgi:hypothetical protein